jgi:hypothetical protein
LQEGSLRRREADRIADALVSLFGETFGGKRSGRYRISRKFLRQICGRRRLNSELLANVTEEVFERGYVFIDLETHFAVVEQTRFNSYRRVTAAAAAKVEALTRGGGGAERRTLRTTIGQERASAGAVRPAN